MKFTTKIVAAVALAFSASAAFAQGKGAVGNEIVIGSMQDLSGPIVAFSKQLKAGMEMKRGAEAGLKEVGQVLGERTTYKRGATDFSSQVARMKDANCDLVVLGTIIRETIGAIGTARKLGWNVDMLGSSAAYTELIHKLGGPAMNGFYATNTVNVPYLDDASKNVRDWAQRYKERTKEDPAVFSVYGYTVIDLFAQVATKAGPKLTTDSFIAALESFTGTRDMFGGDGMTFSKTKHLGSNRSRLSQIVGGKWTPQTDYLTE
jgi:branched-chain amino acid transport system substrate-binding protein